MEAANVLRIVDISRHANGITSDLVAVLNRGYYDYEDKNLNEHIFNTANLLEEFEEAKYAGSTCELLPHETTIEEIATLCRKNEAGYFRIIND